ncbi:MAG: phytoene desaturase family protein [Ktedonobacteraceae bacterium]
MNNVSTHVHKSIIVIGAGIGGLSAAIRLAAQGHHVTILERQTQVGGKLNHVEMNGFSFDTGPSLITMPYVLEDLFSSAQRNLKDYLDLLPLDITCRYFYHDGVVLNAWRDHERLAEEFARLNPHDGAALYRFLDHARNIYQAAADPFLYHSLGSPLNVLQTFVRYVLRGHPHSEADHVQCESMTGAGNMTGLAPMPPNPTMQTPVMPITTLVSRLKSVLAALSPETLDSSVCGFFEDEHLRQLFDRYATYNGSSPYQVASVYSIIPYVELADGGWYPRGGIYAIAQALERLACELGVTIKTSCDVRRILVKHDEARGVVLADGRVLRSDIVIANSDVVTTHRELLSPAVHNKRRMQFLEQLEPSCSGFVLLLGIDKQYPQLAHHNIFFSDGYPAEFDDLFERHIPLSNPTIYVCDTTRSDLTQAPPGHENLFVLVNAPYLTDKSDWKRDAPAYRDRILDLLAGYKQVDLRDLREHIVCEAILTPEDFQKKYGANAGSIYGLSSNSRMAPFTRPGNTSEIRNLYFVGGSTHPGGGVPLVMLSGKIVAELVGTDLSRPPDGRDSRRTR